MAAEAYLRLYEELNDCLPASKRKREFAFRFEGMTTVQQMLEILKVPASEVEFVLINGSSADLSRFLEDGDRVSIYPVFESFDVRPLLRLRSEPLRQTKFMLDTNLRRLAYYLRVLGFDVLVSSHIRAANQERRILLTVDPAVLKNGFTHIYIVREKKPWKQAKEVLTRFDLFSSVRFSRIRSLLVRLLAR